MMEVNSTTKIGALTTAAKLSGSDTKDIGGDMHFINFDPPACPFIIYF